MKLLELTEIAKKANQLEVDTARLQYLITTSHLLEVALFSSKKAASAKIYFNGLEGTGLESTMLDLNATDLRTPMIRLLDTIDEELTELSIKVFADLPF
jgi:hypothetical protein